MTRAVFLLAALLTAGVAPTAMAQVSVNIELPGVVQVAPPAPRYERMPGPRSDHVWVPGHWQWSGRDYRWRTGYWQAARPDYVYAPGAWIRVDDGWRWRDGDWRRAQRREDHREARREDHRHDGNDDRRGGNHCPPGRAKKGGC